MTHRKKAPRQDQTNNAPLLIVTVLIPPFFSVKLKKRKIKKRVFGFSARVHWLNLAPSGAIGCARPRKGKIYPKTRSWPELITLFLLKNSRDLKRKVKKKDARIVRE